MSSSFGQFIETLRKTKKMSLREAAEKSGLSYTYIRDLEIGHGRRTKTPIKPTVETLMSLARAYDYPENELIERYKALGKISENEVPIIIKSDSDRIEWELNLKVFEEIVEKLRRGERGDIPETNANGIEEFLSFQIKRIKDALNEQK